MKKYMKKIIVGIFGFALLFVAQSAFAGTWNGVSGDCPDINIANYTTNNGYGSPCWNGTNISAKAGDIINVKVYYHNTSNTTNTNTRIKVFAPTGSSMNHSFSAQILSNQGNLYTQNVSVNLSSSQTLSLLSAKWYPNQTQVEASLPNGQSSSAVLSSSGLNIGDIAPGWNTQGSINVAFKVSDTIIPETCKDPSATNYGGTLPCTYPAQLCKDPSASNYNGALPCTYPAQLCKDPNATNYNGSLPCVYPQPTVCLIKGFSASPSTITVGDSSVLNWSTSGCNLVSISPTIGTVNEVDYETVKPSETTIYTLAARSQTGIYQYLTRTVVVNQLQLCKDTSATNYGKSLPCNYPVQLCKDPSASNYNNPIPCTYPAQLCKDPNATNYNGSLPCAYPVLLCQDPSAINYRGPLPCNYPSRICLDPSASNYRGLLPCTYPIRLCQDPNASNYRGGLPCEYPVRVCTDPGASNYRGSLPCEYPVRICQDPGASNYRGSLPCYYPQPTRLYCQDTGASNYRGLLPCEYPVRLCQDPSASNYRGSLPCYYPPTQQLCQDPTATNYKGALPCNYVIYVNKNVVTTVATNISKNEAQVNGYITSSSYYNANTYFEYGTTINLGSRTTSKNTIGNSNMSDYLRGLSPNTLYYFRAVGEGPDGISKGSIEIFRTLKEVTVQPIIIQGTTVIGRESPVLLNITNRYQVIGEGDLIDYVVTYKNIGKTRLVKPMVQVILPTNVTLVNSSRGTYAVDTHTLSAQVEDLNAGEEGVIYLQGQVDSIPLNNSQIPTTAILIYTNTNGSQENVMAYVINVPRLGGLVSTIDNSVLGSAAFFGGLFSIGLVGWLLIILLILLIILIARSYRKTSSESKTVIHTTTH
ncbi:MAG: hypothetical protein UR85_C0002G0047 [Candidatus Nomurabacteria bacterium GW2011_GWF2_35_66]|nr:MAG: hypothetical protein UR55_C0004G0007 [Candidatus Nomurabacteria bacterium GW2011_GWF1_34_20]KKP63446.1 MAG: hypothetical protein UR57_C0004G0007 [Candidatus Nomurabacteria bacterium GW2011_GWE2_34_25]KKP83734.1 MAG: hypothetical protein UR85_C0002G0047 [Candidatus Nomurabacteria bacterium GW2011_GWF2_35_66]HAE36423.1 hypothetical protein [Candidatus Nomurabacteria bacterium]HAX65185.1 hypothetical protein [Candidatus Nomurabacteria bacterium]